MITNGIVNIVCLANILFYGKGKTIQDEWVLQTIATERELSSNWGEGDSSVGHHDHHLIDHLLKMDPRLKGKGEMCTWTKITMSLESHN